MRNITRNFDIDIAMALFKQFQQAACIFLAKKNLSPSSLFMERSFAATHYSKVKFLKRAKKTTLPQYTHSFLLSFLFSRHRSNPFRLKFASKLLNYQDYVSRTPFTLQDKGKIYFTQGKGRLRIDIKPSKAAKHV